MLFDMVEPWMGHTIGKFWVIHILVSLVFVCDRYSSDYAHLTVSNTFNFWVLPDRILNSSWHCVLSDNQHIGGDVLSWCLYSAPQCVLDYQIEPGVELSNDNRYFWFSCHAQKGLLYNLPAASPPLLLDMSNQTLSLKWPFEKIFRSTFMTVSRRHSH